MMKNSTIVLIAVIILGIIIAYYFYDKKQKENIERASLIKQILLKPNVDVSESFLQTQTTAWLRDAAAGRIR